MQLLDWGLEDSHEHEDYKSNRNGMPFFDLCLENLMIMYNTNFTVQEKFNKLINEFCQENNITQYKLYEDENGLQKVEPMN